MKVFPSVLAAIPRIWSIVALTVGCTHVPAKRISVLLLAAFGSLVCVHERPAGAEDLQIASPIPLLKYRICNTSPLRPYGRDELSPEDMRAELVDPAPIVDASVLRLRSEYPPGTCDAPCREKVAEAVVASLNLWRQQCLRCGPGMFVFVVDDEFVYVEQNIAPRFVDTKLSLAKRLLNSHEVLLSLTGDRPVGDGHVFGSYVRMRRDARALLELCETDLSAPMQGIWAGPLKVAVCSRDYRTRLPVLTISFTMESPCGKAGWIACGRPDAGVEIGLVGSRFVLSVGPTGREQDGATFVLGDPSAKPIDLEVVFMHEIGHYLGLGHLSLDNMPASRTARPVMLDTFDEQSCISLAETMMLNSAASAGWRYRAKPCSGLKRPESIRR